jgi:predicted short-subunit dehydrogenase-like oxidoreductase (DUF2520 family)
MAEPIPSFEQVAIIGAGKVGSVLALALNEAGYPVVACASRSLPSAERLARRIEGCEAYATSAEAAAQADVVVLTVPDDALANVAQGIAWKPRHLAIHCSGALPAAAIAAAMDAGARVAGFHPIQTFADTVSGLANLPGSAVGVEAGDDVWPWLAGLARDLGTTALRISSEHRALYHAACVLTSNGTVGLLAVAANLWQALGVNRTDAVQALLPLLAGTVRNLETLGIPDALTGPAVRGDVGTIDRHLAALAQDPLALEIYRALGRALIELTRERGTISDAQLDALEDHIATPLTPESPRSTA